MFCNECGEEMEVVSGGVAHHVDPDTGGVDYEADAEHTAYCLEEEQGA